MFVIQSAQQEIRVFLGLFRLTSGEKRLSLLRLCMSMRGIFQFGQFLELPCVQQLRDSKDSVEAKIFLTLELLTNGTLSTYNECPEKYLDMKPMLMTKLRQLTILSLAHDNPIMPFDVLVKSLNVDTYEEAIIYVREAISDGAIQATIDDKKFIVTVKSACARDDTMPDLDSISIEFEDDFDDDYGINNDSESSNLSGTQNDFNESMANESISSNNEVEEYNENYEQLEEDNGDDENLPDQLVDDYEYEYILPDTPESIDQSDEDNGNDEIDVQILLNSYLASDQSDVENEHDNNGNNYEMLHESLTNSEDSNEDNEHENGDAETEHMLPDSPVSLNEVDEYNGNVGGDQMIADSIPASNQTDEDNGIDEQSNDVNDGLNVEQLNDGNDDDVNNIILQETRFIYDESDDENG